MSKEYLGDGVYADTDGYHIILTTEDGISVTNTIFLDASVCVALAEYLKRVDAEAAAVLERGGEPTSDKEPSYDAG